MTECVCFGRAVRKDLDVMKGSTHRSAYNSTQEMFLTQVGIQNSYSEETEAVQRPFFERQGI